MKVLYYHQYFKTRKGSGGTRSYEFAKELISKGHEVTVICARTNKEDLVLNDFVGRKIRKGIVEGIKIIQIDLIASNKDNYIKRSIKFIGFAIRTIRFAFSEKYDVLFASSTPLTVGIPGLVIKLFRPKTKFIFEVRDLWPELPKAMGVIKNSFLLWLLSSLEGAIYRSANACIGLSPGMVDGIAKKGVPREKIALLPNASDTDLFVPGKLDKSIILNCNKNDFVAIYTGTHGKANGLEFILNVAKYLKQKKVENIKLVLIGQGAKRQELIERAKNEGLENCLFLESVPKSELIRILQAADIGMMILADVPAFAYGTSPNKFFDYIAIGLPVLVNHKGWVADLLNENNCGFAFEANRYEDYADKLIYLSQHKEVCIEMGRNSRNLAEYKFERKKIASEWVSFILNI